MTGKLLYLNFYSKNLMWIVLVPSNRGNSRQRQNQNFPQIGEIQDKDKIKICPPSKSMTIKTT